MTTSSALKLGYKASAEQFAARPLVEFAVLAEELGFAGVATVIALFFFLVHRAFAVGRQAASLERYFAALVAPGIGVWAARRGFIKLGVDMGRLPAKDSSAPLRLMVGAPRAGRRRARINMAAALEATGRTLAILVQPAGGLPLKHPFFPLLAKLHLAASSLTIFQSIFASPATARSSVIHVNCP